MLGCSWRGDESADIALDAAYVFAYPIYWDQSKDDPPLKLWAVQFGMDNGASWTGPPRPKKDRYSKHHRYRYVVTGAGHPLTIRLTDPWSNTDYGQLRVVVEPAD